MREGTRYDCADCGVNTRDVGEYYCVHDALWEEYVGARVITEDGRSGPGSVMLCVGCLERRMGRRLCTQDFRDAPVNWLDFPGRPTTVRSPRLRSRLWSDPTIATLKKNHALAHLFELPHNCEDVALITGDRVNT